MGKLHVLPSQIANMIAAGEVVGRPASVVKELMENSVDAGASSVSVNVTDSGRTLIQVIDNGSGMAPEDAVLCFERHATSKISSAEDLDGIVTFGFRGEALPSIAAVSEVTLRTRRPEDETGTQVTIGNYGQMESTECSTPVGTSISIRNLFYNTPARRKFLKSDNVELRHIIEEFNHVALTRPEIAFSLTHNGREIYVLKPAKSLKFRILDLLGTGVAGDLVDISTDTSVVTVNGFIGRPESARKAQGNQYFFVNGRYFRSPYFHKAVMNAYSEMVPDGVTPSYFLYLAVDPDSIDVNISPTKTEIKFEQDSVIFQTLYASVRETLGRNSFGASIDFDNSSAHQMPLLGRSFSEYRGDTISPSKDFDPGYNPFDTPKTPAESTFSPFSSEPYHAPAQDYGVLFENKRLPNSQAMVLGGKFIVSPSSSGMLVVNIRRACFRILYERLLHTLKADGCAVSQAPMFPVQVQVGAENVPIIEDSREHLTRLGFEIVPFGPDTVAVNALPEGYDTDEMSVRETVAELLQTLAEGHRSLPEMMQADTAMKFAKIGAARFKLPGTPHEAAQLLDELFSCDSPDITPSGAKITSVIPLDELEKKF